MPEEHVSEFSFLISRGKVLAGGKYEFQYECLRCGGFTPNPWKHECEEG